MNRNLTQQIWIYTLFIVSLGLVALYSASYQNVRVPLTVFYDQLVMALVGFLLMFFLGKLDYRKYYDVAYAFYIFNIFLLIFVLVAGRHALGATRWISVAGVSFQPSELTKLAIILVLGRYISNRRSSLPFNLISRIQVLLKDLIIPLLTVLLPMFLILKQPDLGTSLLMLGIFLGMIVASGLSYKYIFGFLLGCVSFAPVVWKFMKPYQKDRLLVFMNPNIDPLGAGYTIIQSKIAIGSGKLFGKGWLSGTQNQLNFLPERHTDFIFSVIGEEWGFVGAAVLIVLYFLLIQCALSIADQVNDKFGTLVVVGIVTILTLQVIINIGMVMGLFPIVGLTLPLVSYGRTSFMVFMIMMGFLLNLSKKRTIF